MVALQRGTGKEEMGVGMLGTGETEIETNALLEISPYCIYTRLKIITRVSMA